MATAEAGAQEESTSLVRHDTDSASEDEGMPDLLDLFGEEFFALDLPGGGKAKIDDDEARKMLMAHRRAAQQEYEEALLVEVRKLQQISKLDAVHRKQEEKDRREKAEREARARKDESERRRKHLEKEAAAEEQEKRQTAEWITKQRESKKRAEEIERRKQEVIDRERYERQRALQVAREKQQEIAARALRDKERQAAIKRQLDEQKQAALLERLERRRQERLEANQRKAQVAAERVYRAWQNRKEQLEQAEAAYNEKHAKQEERLRALNESKAEHQEAQKRKAAQKRHFIEKVVSSQLDNEEAMKQEIERRHAEKAEKAERAEKEHLKEMERVTYERLAQQHAARERARAALVNKVESVQHLEGKWVEKAERSRKLLEDKERHAAQRRALFGLLTRERQTVLNAMERSKVTKRFELPAHIRKNIADPVLKHVLDQADPKQTGTITLTHLSDILATIDPGKLTYEALRDEATAFSEAEIMRAEKVFNKMDKDGDRRVDYHEFKAILTKLLRQRGQERPSEEWLTTAFSKVDINGNGTVDFDEFTKVLRMVGAGEVGSEAGGAGGDEGG